MKGRPPVIAVVLSGTETPRGCYEAYPDLDGVCEIVSLTVSYLQRDLWVSLAVNLLAEQILVNWTLCNRLQHMLSIQPSDFAADREKVKPSRVRDA